MRTKTIGREATCDLVIEHTTTSRQHGRLELTEDGRVWVVDTASRNGIFLHRNDAWIRVHKMMLCVGDRLRFGDYELPLQVLTAVFGRRARVLLGEKHFSLRHGTKTTKAVSGWDEPSHALQKPKRNPLTGRIEEDR